MDFHFPNAIKNGVTETEIVEMITHLAFYVSWPSAMSAVNRAKALFETKERT
jgi:4-carboxymuconolactone decarboxylase